MKNLILMVLLSATSNLICMDSAVKELNQKSALVEDLSQLSQNELNDRLLKAAEEGNAHLVQLLIDNKANIEATFRGLTPLHMAATYGHYDVVQLLIGNNANIEAADRGDQTPLHRAAQYGYSNIVKLLIANKANIEATDHVGCSPLLVAAGEGHCDIVQLLIDNNANIEGANHDWDVTPLLASAGEGHSDVVQLLMDNKANIEATNKDGKTPLWVSAFRGKNNVCNMILRYHYKIFLLDKTTVNDYRKRLKTALLCLKTTPLPEDKHYEILLHQPLLNEVAYILIDELQRGLPIKSHSLLRYNEVKDAAAGLILDISQRSFNDIYEFLIEVQPMKQFFAPENRKKNSLPLIREGIERQVNRDTP